MATTRPFAHNPSLLTVSGTTPVGNLLIGESAQNYSANPGGLGWWMGPDEDLGWVIATSVPTYNQPTNTPSGAVGSVQFWRTQTKTDQAFLNLANSVKSQFTGSSNFADAAAAATWLTANGYWTSWVSSIPSGTVYTSATVSGGVTTVAQSPFVGGGNSYSLNGSNGYLSLPANSSWALGTGDFTIEWFQYQTDSSSFPRIFAMGSYPSTTIGCSIEGGTFYVWLPGANSFGTVSVKNAWHHFAIVRSGTSLKVYLNGNQIGSTVTNSTNVNNTSTTLYLGAENGGNAGTFFGGYLTNFRLVKGLAVYTGNFTKPTGQLTLTAAANPYGGVNTSELPDGYTKLLLVP